MDPLGIGDVRCEERWVEVEPGVALRALVWTPERRDAPDVIFVPGWISRLHGWRPVLERMVRDRRVAYVESREKPSARLPRRLRAEGFTVARMARDLAAATEALGLDPSRAVAFGSSLGATAILEALKGGAWPVRAAFAVGPNARFRIPRWAGPLLHLPAGTYHVLKHVVVWYLARFRVDAEREPEQMARYRATVLEAEPRRLKLSARALARYEIWPGLETVTTPVAIAYAPTDTLHEVDLIERMVAVAPGAVAVRCPSNLYMHRPEIVEELDRFVAGLDTRGG